MVVSLTLFYREFMGGEPLPGRLSYAEGGDWVRADMLTSLSQADRSRFREAVKFERLPFAPGLDERGLELLVSPLHMKRRRRGTAPTAYGFKLGGGLEEYAETCALPLGGGRNKVEPVLLPRGLSNGPQWVDELAKRKPWSGWDNTDTGEACVVWPGVEPLEADPPLVGVVVTVHNKPDRAVPCLESIAARTRYPNLRVYVINDGSNEYTSQLLDREYGEREGWQVLRHRNTGYLETANRGARVAMSEGCGFVVFVNSDVRVTDGWLGAMVTASLRTDAAMVNPLSNQQGPISLPLALEKSWGFPRLPGGVNYRQAALAASLIPPSYPEAVTSVGQCLLVRRKEWLKLGPFDGDLYGSGYGEECELWARVISEGGGAVVADDAYVYHESHATHENADDRERAGAERFISRWRDLYGMKAKKIRLWPNKCVNVRSVAGSLKPTGLPVRFVMMNIGQYGGVYCVLRLVDELNERGFNASAEFTKLQDHSFKLTTGPSQHPDPNALRRLVDNPNNLGGFVVATHWFTGELMAANVRRSTDFIPLAFWQDREDLFVEPNGTRSVRPGSVSAYLDIEHKIVNAQWVADTAKAELDVDGFNVIPVGVDCNRFYPSKRASGGPVRILAMHRPSTPRRGAKRLLEVYKAVKAAKGGAVIFETFGEACTWSDFHYGTLSQDAVAELLRGVDILIEPSEFQGFGLPGLEAMASGAVLVSTDNQGVHEYGTHGSDCFIEGDGQTLEDLTLRCIEDAKLRAKIGEQARETALSFDWGLLADRWARTLATIYAESGRTRHLQTVAQWTTAG